MINKKQFRIFTIVDLDKEEEYLHEMHLKGWRYRTSRFGFFYFDQCQPDDVIYRIYDSRFLKKYKKLLRKGSKTRKYLARPQVNSIDHTHYFY